MGFGFAEGISIIVALTAVISAYYAGHSARTAEKALAKENKELKDQNEILKGFLPEFKDSVYNQIQTYKHSTPPILVESGAEYNKEHNYSRYSFQNIGGKCYNENRFAASYSRIEKITYSHQDIVYIEAFSSISILIHWGEMPEKFDPFFFQLDLRSVSGYPRKFAFEVIDRYTCRISIMQG